MSADWLDWTELYHAHAPRLRQVIRRRVSAAEVEDVLQETFLRAYRSRGGFDASRPVGPWLTTIAIRVSMNKGHAPIELHRFGAELPWAPDAADAYAASERERLVARAFLSLNSRHRMLLQAVALDGTSQVAIAKREGISPEAVRATVARARARFRTALEQAAQEHGLAGLGSGMTRVLARIRGRLLQLESNGLRAIEGLAAVFGATAAVGSVATSVAITPSAAPVVEIRAPVALKASTAVPTDNRGRRADAAQIWASPPRLVATVDAPRAGLNGFLQQDATTLDTFWTLQIAPLWTEITVGTNGRDGRLGLRTHVLSENGDSRGEAGTDMTCDDSSARTTVVKCETYDEAEVLARSTD